MQINDNPVIVDKMTPMNKISIWEPRYHDNRVLIHPNKVSAHNKIVFTKAPSLSGTYYLAGRTIRKYNKVSNGSVQCYAVPISELRPLQINEKDIRILI